MIPRIDMQKLVKRDPQTMGDLRRGAEDIGFLILYNTAIDAARIDEVIAAYADFFHRDEAVKQAVNMARTGANRGWGAGGAEQVDPMANPDYKEVYDCGFELPAGDALTAQNLSVYAPNLWPADMPEFRATIEGYYHQALEVCRTLLRAIAAAIGEDDGYFDDKFSRPMALLRGNFYPARPDWAGEKDFGIAAHTDYGCVTLLATDGVPGLEVKTADGTWRAVETRPGSFIINFGEMLQMWTRGRVTATVHRVRGSGAERISVPLFFNPNYDTNVAPLGSGEEVLAGRHLKKRFDETYLHLKNP